MMLQYRICVFCPIENRAVRMRHFAYMSLAKSKNIYVMRRSRAALDPLGEEHNNGACRLFDKESASISQWISNPSDTRTYFFLPAV